MVIEMRALPMVSVMVGTVRCDEKGTWGISL